MNVLARSSSEAYAMQSLLQSSNSSAAVYEAAAASLANSTGLDPGSFSVSVSPSSVRVVSLQYSRSSWRLLLDWLRRNILQVLACACALMLGTLLCCCWGRLSRARSAAHRAASAAERKVEQELWQSTLREQLRRARRRQLMRLLGLLLRAAAAFVGQRLEVKRLLAQKAELLQERQAELAAQKKAQAAQQLRLQLQAKEAEQLRQAQLALQQAEDALEQEQALKRRQAARPRFSPGGSPLPIGRPVPAAQLVSVVLGAAPPAWSTNRYASRDPEPPLSSGQQQQLDEGNSAAQAIRAQTVAQRSRSNLQRAAAAALGSLSPGGGGERS
jgi:hypothetical protein